MTDIPFRRDNHYLPCVYLKPWLSSDGRVWTYRTLVPHHNVPLWKHNSPRAVAYHAHLYTQVLAGQETDEIERWFDREFESPAEEPLKKATSGARLTPDDWKRLVRFLAAQDVRTPASFVERSKRWQESIPSLIEETLQTSIRAVEEAQRTGQPLPAPKQVENQHNFPSRVMIRRAASGGGEIGAEIVVGRRLWLWSIERALKKTVNALLQHRWTILSPPKELTWFTSDNPVVRLNFRSITNYNFDGGWGSPGTCIFLPISPEHLLYTQIGKRPPRRGEIVTRDNARLVRRFTAEHAWRMIFALEQDEEVSVMHPRRVDPNEVQRERDQWATWHNEQTAAEQRLLARRMTDEQDR